jgi:hypothetical protein
LKEPLVELGGEVDSAVGDVDHVTAALTVTEFAKDVVVEREVWEPVQRRRPVTRNVKFVRET